MAVELYDFRPRRVLTLAPWDVERLLGSEAGEIAVGPGVRARFRVEGGVVRLEFLGMVFEVARRDLERVAGRGGKMVVVGGGAVAFAEIRSTRYYKLAPVRPGSPPTLEIDGIHMHRVKDVDPGEDTRIKVAAVGVRRGDRVLDLCTGLGYTAIESLRRGASMVVTVEVDENVLSMAAVNPWSWGLESDRVVVVLGDAYEAVKHMPDNYFDRVIHDPPRLTASTGHLYSLGLYLELLRVLRPGGRLFHYTGDPGRLKGLNLPGRVASRLRDAGFEAVRVVERAQGVVARKPLRGP